ncbi:MAG: RNA polymerase subunit sigma-70 [Firmicutes bacterium HGW-Firmicutes-7]|nr:MAG: RNA polymerase subunit sigma-70 [Firmicutes bacterium HGW-Firmicutes-7]
MLQQYLIENREAHYRMAFSYTKNKEDALDVVQDSIEKALRAYKRKDKPNHLKSWYYRILINTAIDCTRRNKRIVLMEQEKMAYFLEKEDQYMNFDLKTAMEKLPNAYKTIIVLRYFEDLKISDIAEILNENVNTIKTRLYKGLKILKIELKEDYNE